MASPARPLARSPIEACETDRYRYRYRYRSAEAMAINAVTANSAQAISAVLTVGPSSMVTEVLPELLWVTATKPFRT